MVPLQDSIVDFGTDVPTLALNVHDTGLGLSMDSYALVAQSLVRQNYGLWTRCCRCNSRLSSPWQPFSIGSSP